jgi:hypothetical protein
VTNGKIAADAVTGDKVNESTLAEVPAANSANPGVFAHVKKKASSMPLTPRGSLLPASAKSAPVFSVTVPSFAPPGAQVTPEAGAVITPATSAKITFGGIVNCASSAVQVLTFVGAAPENLGFYIELYR